MHPSSRSASKDGIACRQSFGSTVQRVSCASGAGKAPARLDIDRVHAKHVSASEHTALEYGAGNIAKHSAKS